jgi:hypothetical protein
MGWCGEMTGAERYKEGLTEGGAFVRLESEEEGVAGEAEVLEERRPATPAAICFFVGGFGTAVQDD